MLLVIILSGGPVRIWEGEKNYAASFRLNPSHYRNVFKGKTSTTIEVKMKEIKATQINTAYGELTVRMRFFEKYIFIKSNNSQQRTQVIDQLKSGGAEVIENDSGWVRVDMIKDHERVRLGGQEFNPQEKSWEELEQIMVDFFSNKYEEAKFIVNRIK